MKLEHIGASMGGGGKRVVKSVLVHTESVRSGDMDISSCEGKAHEGEWS